MSTAISPVPTFTTAATFEALEEAAMHTVTLLASNLCAPPGVSVTTSVGQGGAAALLLDAARRSDLLVVGSRGRGGFARLLLGSTSTQCATHSSAPVAVIPSSAAVERPRSVLVAFDGSRNSISALEWALGFADGHTVVSCVSVWDSTPVAVGADQFFFPEASDLAQERFEHLAADVSNSPRWADVDYRSVFLEGRPRNVLAEQAESCDLLVVGARGHGAIGAAVLGSVSTWLLHHVSAAMVVVPCPSHVEEVDEPDGERQE